ncbi:MAG: helix-turn-helix domain-containing protein, partial [Lactococcus raffinolactis]
MDITYKKLWKILIDKEMNKTQLKEAAGVSSNVIAKLG